jgi:hypothetical protein
VTIHAIGLRPALGPDPASRTIVPDRPDSTGKSSITPALLADELGPGLAGQCACRSPTGEDLVVDYFEEAGSALQLSTASLLRSPQSPFLCRRVRVRLALNPAMMAVRVLGVSDQELVDVERIFETCPYSTNVLVRGTGTRGHVPGDWLLQ